MLEGDLQGCIIQRRHANSVWIRDGTVVVTSCALYIEQEYSIIRCGVRSKNAQEAIQAYAESKSREPGWTGRIETNVRRNGTRVDIEVIDNGPGLPQNRVRLTEPYVTTKGAKGTGLGLAIVQKSVEQHAGQLYLEDAPPAPDRTHGAMIRISLPAHPAGDKAGARPAPAKAVAGSA